MSDQAVERGAPAAATPADVFVGRERELHQLEADLDSAGLSTLAGRPSPHCRVLLIAGRPGSGRTTLAEEFVRRVAPRYPDGVLRTRLTDPGGTPVPTERTARDLLAALRSWSAPPGADLDDLTAALRAELAGRRMVLLLDDVAAPEQVLELLPDTRDCLAVAVAAGPLTSVPDVRPCTVGGLDRAAAVALLRSRTGPTPRLTVDPRRAESLAEACGDLPAALLMVGGWLAARPRLSVSEATALLERTGHGATAEDRLARAFRLTAGSLPAPAARTLRLLAAAPAGFVDAQTASALTGSSYEAARATLDELSALALLRPAAPGCWTVPGCLEGLLRAEMHAHERPGEVMLARARVLERTVRRLHACWAVTEPPGSAAREWLAGLPRALRFSGAEEARAWLEPRLPVLLASVRLAVADGGGELDTLARRLVHALTRCFAVHRGAQEAAPEVYRLDELVLRVTERRGLHRERAATLLTLAAFDAEADRCAQAAARYRDGLDAARAARDHATAGRALEALGETYGRLGDWPRAADWYGRALAQRQTAADLAGAARLHGRLADAYGRSGDRAGALREWRAAAAVCRRLGDLAGLGRALGAVARALEHAGRLDDALRTCGEALAAGRRARDVALQAELRTRLADLCERTGDRAAARRHRAAGEELKDLTRR